MGENEVPVPKTQIDSFISFDRTPALVCVLIVLELLMAVEAFNYTGWAKNGATDS